MYKLYFIGGTFDGLQTKQSAVPSKRQRFAAGTSTTEETTRALFWNEHNINTKVVISHEVYECVLRRYVEDTEKEYYVYEYKHTE